MPAETYGRYQLVKKLATGGMAQIFLARQLGLEGFEKLLVVKRILPHLAENEDFITMFLDEARIAARLNHPNIVQIFDLGAQGDSYFIAMEYIHGEDVRRVWKKAEAAGQPLPVALICRIICEACAGLDYAHKRTDAAGRPLHIVHRDISPQNILVSFEGGVKVVDFGIAKAADQATVTRSGVLKGKYSYMSPEQAGGRPLDGRSDIFALGVVLYELLTQRRLFKRANDVQTLQAVAECAVVSAARVSARVPAALDAVVMKALAKDVGDRYREARELQADLEDFLLSQRLPASSSHLAAFMQDVYRERLAREEEEGRLLFETLDGVRSEEVERATPSQSQPRPATRSGRGASPRASKPPSRSLPKVEATLAERAPRSSPPAREELERAIDALPEPGRRPTGLSASVKTQADRSRVLPFVAVGAAGAVAAFLVGALAFRGPGAPTLYPLSVSSDPPGALVLIDGRAVCRTPCALPPHAAGLVPLRLTLDGYRALEVQARLPSASGAPVAYTLAKAEPALAPRAAPPLALTIASQPPAEVTVDGRGRGRAPVTVEVAPGAEVAVELALAGYEPLSDVFRAEEAAPERRYQLTKLKAEAPRAKQPLQPPEARPLGSALFLVKPWAAVSCGGKSLGDTPFPPVALPVGAHRCTFTNPELGARTVLVKVEPSPAVTKVQVDLTP